MNELEPLVANEKENILVLEQSKEDEVLVSLVDRLDLTDVVVLKKFYSTGKTFPFDTQPFCFPILFKEMRENNNLKIGSEALRKRLDILVEVKLLEKVNKTNPTTYFPINGKEKFIRLLITKFFVLNGLTKFL